jgi:hypothetical protein
VQVVARQHSSGAAGHARPAALARAATGAGEHQVIGIAAWGELAADRLDHQRGQRYRADAGVALGAWLEATAEPAGLIAGGADLEHRQGSVEVDPAPAQPGQLAKAQAGAEQREHVVPPEQREPGQQPPGLLGGEGTPLGFSEDLLGIDSAFERRHLADRVGVDRSLVHGVLEDPERQ